ncbi:MAG: asparaginase domain-containing protein [Gemmataceae bacterium]
MTIHFLSAGGTIDKVYFDAKSEFQVGPPQVAEILKLGNVGFTYESSSVLKKDSLEMTDADRANIRRAVEAVPGERIVITHGTDTMADTARALLGIPGKTIVLTGAMEPARLRDSDAPFNVGCAVAAVQTLPPGVYVAMNGQVFPAEHVRKNREARRFEES